MKPFIVGLGGTATPGGSTEQALALTLRAAEAHGARTKLFGGALLASFPHYLAEGTWDCVEAKEFVAAIRQANGIIIASPGYHGTISGLVKNAIDYIEETSKDSRVYLDGLPVGLIATAYGWQATGSTMTTLRAIVHALRGWPTPMGAGVRTVQGLFKDGQCTDPAVSGQLEIVGRQVAEFASLQMRDKLATATHLETWLGLTDCDELYQST